MTTTADTSIEVKKQDISASVLKKINEFKEHGAIKIPADYSPENALKAAYLVLSDPRSNLLSKCTKESVANALLKMVVWGLSPLKKQCSFIPYGDKLECTPEYTGNVAMAKRYGGLKSIKANAIHAGDVFIFEIDNKTGKKRIVKHEQTLESISNKELQGAYAIVELADGTIDTYVMSMQQIKDSWNQGAMKGNSPAHKLFPDQMAEKTVINRACKLIIRTSDDAILSPDEEEDAKPDDAKLSDSIHKSTVEDISFEMIADSSPESAVIDSAENKGESVLNNDKRKEADNQKEVGDDSEDLFFNKQ